MKAKPKDPGQLPREEVQRALNEVRIRYGLHPPQQEELPRVQASTSSQKASEQQPRHSMSLGQPASKISLVAAEGDHSADWPLDLGWVRYPTTPATPIGSGSDNYCYHYLIRVAECALTLHCEINSDNEAAARNQVQQIPNLLEWRQISREELAEVLRLEIALTGLGT